MSSVRETLEALIDPLLNRPLVEAGRLESVEEKSRGRVTVSLALDGDVIRDVAFEGAGCAISTAAASMMTEAVKGRTVAEAEALFERFHDLVAGDEADGDDTLGKLAAFAGVRRYPARVKCATLAWHTLKAAMEGADETATTE